MGYASTPSDSRFRSDLELAAEREMEAKETLGKRMESFEKDEEYYYVLPVYCRNCLKPFSIKVPKGWTVYENGGTRYLYYFPNIQDKELDERTYVKCTLCSTKGEVTRDEKRSRMMNALAYAKAEEEDGE